MGIRSEAKAKALRKLAAAVKRSRSRSIAIPALSSLLGHEYEKIIRTLDPTPHLSRKGRMVEILESHGFDLIPDVSTYIVEWNLPLPPAAGMLHEAEPTESTTSVSQPKKAAPPPKETATLEEVASRAVKEANEINASSSASTGNGPLESSGDAIDALLSVLPARVRRGVRTLSKGTSGVAVVDVIIDVGRVPHAMASVGDTHLFRVDIPGATEVITNEELRGTIAALAQATGRDVDRLFTANGRVGIDRTLHRISRVVGDTDGTVAGLTCRIGRSIKSSLDIVSEIAKALVKDRSASLLVIGPPGVGKTTLLRALASSLSDTRNVVVVDPDGEIAGSGAVPHPAIGNARRVRVPSNRSLGDTMLEVVKNHTPDTVLIDEIGGHQEVAAAKSIAQRGVSLIASAHGRCLADILREPSLRVLLGGVTSTTIGDTSLAARGLSRKTVLERPHPSHFSVAIEVVRVGEVVVHHSVNSAVDDLLAGARPHADHRSAAVGSREVTSEFREIDRSNMFASEEDCQ